MDSLLAARTTWHPPGAFDEYQLLRLLGRGGMGEVYLAHDTLLDRLVAVKFLGALDPDAEAREQLLHEARAAARLQHPNVVSVYRVGELDGRPYIISEFVRGKELDLVEKPLPWRRALELGIGLSRGLAAAHRRGVLHRDIKPGNAILTEDGDVKLVDFGLAQLMDRSVELPPASGDGPVSRDAPTLDVAVPRFLADAGGPVSGRRRVPPGAGASEPPPESAPLSARGGPASLSRVSASIPPAPRPPAPPASTVQGTPNYLSPELWRGEAPSFQSDVYALGVVLFELCAGTPPFASVPFSELGRAVVRRDAPLLADVAPGIDPRLGAIVDRCLRRAPEERFATGEDLREALELLLTSAPREALPPGNPYRGLLPFDAEHRALFFGRASEIGLIVDRLRAEPFLLIAGDSGAGKSSLCGAGVLPLVADGALGQGRAWAVRRLTPGKRPLAALALALADLLEADEESLRARLGEGPRSLARELRRRLGNGRGLLLHVDQLEELITLADPTEAQRAGAALGQLLSGMPGLRLLMAVRSDFLARVAAVPGLGDDLSRGLYLLRPLSPDKIREAIVGPARATGVAFESAELVDTLVASTARAEGLPLLQFALAELWGARPDLEAPITGAALEAIGGVAGALARHADRVVLGLPAEHRAAARRILVAMVTLEGTRARRAEAELLSGGEAARAALEALVRGRLLVAQEGEEGAVYQIAHEALLRGWDTLRRWLDELEGTRAVRLRLEAAAAEWERLGGAREALWGARQLDEAAQLDAADLGGRERAFLSASRRAVRRGRRIRQAALIGAPLAVLLLYGAVQVKVRREVHRTVAAQLDQAAELHAEARRKGAAVEARRAEAFAAFDARRRDEGERAWAEALALSSEVDDAYGAAAQALEGVLLLDARADARARLADVLYERALVAERDGRAAQRNDLLQRLALHDVTGERRRRWDAPAQIAVESTPAGARVTLERVEPDEHGKLRAAFAGLEFGRTPLPDVERVERAERSEPVELPRGSYVLVLEAEGHAAVRYPVLLRRGERLSLRVDLPRAAQIPEGYVYIPPGRFLFGSAADEGTRAEFLSTAPVHEITTGAYLIARHETTYRDWIEYLGALPSEERARRALRVGKGAPFQLDPLPEGGWQLTFQPTTQVYSARSGEPLRYRARAARATQNWLRLPVSGLTVEDASAYAAWLAETGRVPGARLCTEIEWERAARGADDREFPHGAVLDAADANFDQTYGKEMLGMGPDEVGSHPASRSPFGLDDMAGNVYEWTVSALKPREYVARGGAYFYSTLTCRSSNRTPLDPTFRDPGLGVRICAAAPSPARSP